MGIARAISFDIHGGGGSFTSKNDVFTVLSERRFCYDLSDKHFHDRVDVVITNVYGCLVSMWP